MKYDKEYKITNNKYKFIQLLLSKYPIKPATAERRYYELRKKYKDSKKTKPYTPPIHPDEVVKPSHTRFLELEDMKRMNVPLTKKNLMRYGFLEYEINWLVEHGGLVLDK